MKVFFLLLGLTFVNYATADSGAIFQSSYLCKLKPQEDLIAEIKITVDGVGEKAQVNYDLTAKSLENIEVSKMKGVLSYDQDVDGDPFELNWGDDIGVFGGEIIDEDGIDYKVAFFMSKGITRGDKTGKFIFLTLDKFYVADCVRE